MPTPFRLLSTCPEFDSIPGWLSLDEAEYLFSAAATASSGAIVEVGSANGRSTIALSMGARYGQANCVYAVEPHEPFLGIFGGRFGPENRRSFYETMLRFRGWENTRLVNVSSEVLCPGWTIPVSLLWIDGDHRYEAVRRDFDAWQPHLLDDATIIFHDAKDPQIGPYHVVAECISGGRFAHVKSVGEIVAIAPIAANGTRTADGTRRS